MSSDYQTTVQLFQEFKSQFEKGDANKCRELMGRLKIETTKLALPAGSSNSDQEKQALGLLREILEYGALLSIQLRDIPSFERYIAQVKTYYHDYANRIPASSRQFMIVGLNLLHLLSKNKLDEFHTELELIPLETHQNLYIKHPVQLEEYMMEGAYNKVLKAKDTVPDPSYAYFMDILMGTVRNEIADCLVKAYTDLKLADAQKLLALPTLDQARAYAKERNWNLNGDKLTFSKDSDSKSSEIPSMKLIQQQLQYARELERII